MIARALILAVCMLSVSAPAVPAETLKVIVREGAIREQCKFLSPVKARVNYNDEVEVTGKEGDWLRVKFKKVTGCIHKSAVETKSFSLSGIFGSKGKTASKDEVALAGKGFNPQVEDSFRRKHPELSFQTVDRIERIHVSDDELREFIRTGSLQPPK